MKTEVEMEGFLGTIKDTDPLDTKPQRLMHTVMVDIVSWILGKESVSPEQDLRFRMFDLLLKVSRKAPASEKGTDDQ